MGDSLALLTAERLPIQVAAALERGATVITGNDRAARTIRHEVDRRNRELGLKSWQPAKVMAWSGWMRGWWERLIVAGRAEQVLLNRSQELVVWRSVVEADGELASLRTADSLAEMAAEAWTLLCGYNGQSRLRELAVSTDTRAFQRWARGFERRCTAEGYLAEAGLEEALRRGVAGGDEEGGGGELGAKELLLAGFDSLTPAQVGLVGALRSRGVRIEELRVGAGGEESVLQERVLVEAEDSDEELRACARWVRGVWKERPESRIGVVVPGLGGERLEIDRVFREVLTPELEYVGAGRGGRAYEFSLGVPLVSMPMVAVALDVLRWAVEALPLERVSGVMLSPYFANGRAADGRTADERTADDGAADDRGVGGKTGLGARAGFDAFGLRRAKMLRPELSLPEFAALLAKKRMEGLDGLRDAVRRMVQTTGQRVARRLGADESRSHEDWAATMRAVLDAASWGGGTGEDSTEFQVRMKWEGVLDELVSLDFDGTQVRYGAALEEVERIALRTMFSPESHGAAVQVLGPLEAAGSRFDAVWFLRAGELSWPAVAATSPLLPWWMQRELGMPGTEAARELEFARRVTERIAESAGTARFSYARQGLEGEGRQRRSGALAGLELRGVSAAEILAGGVVREIIATEVVEDDVRLPVLPDRVMRGGAALLAAQAACGFRAFVEQRLWSSEPRSTELGMDAAERGTVVHRVLELFWKNLKTQAELKAMTTSEREDVLGWCIAEEMPHGTAATAWDAAYVDMERSRLHTLLGAWLKLELERVPFEVKLSEKQFDDVRVGPLRLKVIVDRVDYVDDAGAEGAQPGERAEMIVDYKTGQADPGQWLSERPDAPQVPLYAVLSDAARLAAVAFAKVRRGEMGLQGYATSSDLVTKLENFKDVETLEEQVEVWRTVLTRLAEEFAAGDARVRPKVYPGTCARCAQRLVCRLDVSLFELEDEELEGADG